ncbi:MAG: hypothetical protein KAW01_08615, partial [Deltaproteobacteria bacterium]|nr:hypothetical protein [Deltaproteobacteria bacterium]
LVGRLKGAGGSDCDRQVAFFRFLAPVTDRGTAAACCKESSSNQCQQQSNKDDSHDFQTFISFGLLVQSQLLLNVGVFFLLIHPDYPSSLRSLLLGTDLKSVSVREGETNPEECKPSG